jgi:hypothetical protein
VGSCSDAELREALTLAWKAGQGHFVIVSHNFEMLQPGSSRPDAIVVGRFERLCRWLADHPQRFTVADLPLQPQPDARAVELSVSLGATARRWQEQIQRRWQRWRPGPSA